MPSFVESVKILVRERNKSRDKPFATKNGIPEKCQSIFCVLFFLSSGHRFVTGFLVHNVCQILNQFFPSVFVKLFCFFLRLTGLTRVLIEFLVGYFRGQMVFSITGGLTRKARQIFHHNRWVDIRQNGRQKREFLRHKNALTASTNLWGFSWRKKVRFLVMMASFFTKQLCQELIGCKIMIMMRYLYIQHDKFRTKCFKLYEFMQKL